VKAVVLLSGGLDSSTTLAEAKAKGRTLYALSFDYGQKNRLELLAAQRLAHAVSVVEHRRLTIDLGIFGGSSLTTDKPIPLHRSLDEIGEGVPSTYVPCRNTLFLSYALAWAEVLRAQEIYIGVNAVDYSGYPDCRPAYIKAFQDMANLATRFTTEERGCVTICTPLIALSKADIIRKGKMLGVDYSLTMTCYEPTKEGISCGLCDSCLLRLNGFREAGITDPLPYA